MFLNYVAGAISLMLAVSTFIPWVTVWFYSIKGIDSVYGIGILVLGLLGVLVSVFQHLSGKNRGRAFVGFGVAALLLEGLFFRKMVVYSQRINEVLTLLNDLFGEALVQKVQQILGEQWTKILSKVIQRAGVTTSVDGMDFVGGGLILATICAGLLLLVGIFMEAQARQQQD